MACRPNLSAAPAAVAVVQQPVVTSYKGLDNHTFVQKKNKTKQKITFSVSPVVPLFRSVLILSLIFMMMMIIIIIAALLFCIFCCAETVICYTCEFSLAVCSVWVLKGFTISVSLTRAGKTRGLHSNKLGKSYTPCKIASIFRVSSRCHPCLFVC